MPYLSLDGRDGHRIHTYRPWNPTLQSTVIGPSIGPSQGKSESFSEFGICTLEEIHTGYLLRIPSGQHVHASGFQKVYFLPQGESLHENEATQRKTGSGGGGEIDIESLDPAMPEANDPWNS